MAEDAIRGYIESLVQHGEPLPIEEEPREAVVSRVVIEEPVGV